MQRMGGIGALAGMIPGMKKLQGAANQSDRRQGVEPLDAIISSMTPRERTKPELMNRQAQDPRRQRSGTHGAGRQPLLKMHQEMATAMKKLKKMAASASWLRCSAGGGGAGLGGLGGLAVRAVACPAVFLDCRVGALVEHPSTFRPASTSS